MSVVLFLFGGVTNFCYFFLLRNMMGVLSSESSMEMSTMGVDDSASLGDGVLCRFSVLTWGVSTTDC